MNPQDFLKKVEDGTLSDDEMRSHGLDAKDAGTKGKTPLST